MQQQELPGKQRRMEKRALPPVVSQLAETNRLGRFTVRYTSTSYTTSGCVFALFLYILTGLFFSASIFVAFYAIGTGVVVLIIALMLFGVIPLLGLTYLVGKRALKAGYGEPMIVYFYQQGLVYLYQEQQVVLRWEQIERIDMIYGQEPGCQVALADGSSVLLMNGVRRGLYHEIRRRVMRYRKKHQHHVNF